MNESRSASIRAAIFDIGGVLTVSPVHRIIDFCRRHGIPDEVRYAIFAPHDGPWGRFERSEIGPEEFASAFDALVRPAGAAVSGREFLEWFGQGFEPRPEMIAVVRHLRGRLLLGCITNNVPNDGRGRERPFDPYELFDVVVESSKVGLRKPDPRIYQLTCDQLGIQPPEAVFLDDLGENLKAARALGMVTIKVDPTPSAIDELERVLGVPLPRVQPNHS
ncbi:MAG: HAD-IA family hydrolase [Chloroflexota bacterium]|jgi:putative hydrolase of the HAD superfamily|nr:HAD-IA family hydrolase [Dehalococcoidia bacterium]MDW8046638.1 HAD-IA family hydrolase [Chloroflexota bacterium]